MNPIDTSGPKEVAARIALSRAVPVSAADPVRPVRSRAADASGPAAATASSRSSVSAPPSVSAGASAPVDADRVHAIRKAVEEGRYPVVPTQIADAIIAAGYLLRTK
jgi:negative regulator of flagellin synthesis FlgM